MSTAVGGTRPIFSTQLLSAASRVSGDSSNIIRMQPALADLALRCGERGALDEIEFFLSWLKIRKKSPLMLSLPSRMQPDDAGQSSNSLDGAVLFYEHRLGQYGLGIFATFDSTGRRTLTSPAIESASFAMMACRTLLKRGAHGILISFRHDGSGLDPAVVEGLGIMGHSFRWASRQREIPDYLELESTLDKTLSRMGSRTRNHLRYYRRRAENQLGCEFVPDPKISRSDFLALNRISAYPATDEIAAWRYDSLNALKDPAFYGLRDRDGNWLSLIGGLHSCGNMETYWQMNRYDLKPYSLSTVMRSFVIEHEILYGTKRLYFEGGTNHSMSHSFMQKRCTDLLILRQTPVGRVVPAMVKRYVPPENPLHEFLEEPNLEWRSVKKL
jgi:hypothetical protein